MNIEQDVDCELERLNTIARRMDALFRIPGTQITIGLENILGLVPVIGDFAAACGSAWIIHRTYRLGARPSTVARMVGNMALDFGIGAIPIIGDVFDVLYNANLRNVRLAREDIEARIHHASFSTAPARSIETSV